MKQDLEAGGFHLKKFLEKRINEQEKHHEGMCANCFNEIDQNNVNNFTLVFGPHDFRKKASFCGQDCLEYFLKELKKMKKEVQ